jgi:hypothetical protein
LWFFRNGDLGQFWHNALFVLYCFFACMWKTRGVYWASQWGEEITSTCPLEGKRFSAKKVSEREREHFEVMIVAKAITRIRNDDSQQCDSEFLETLMNQNVKAFVRHIQQWRWRVARKLPLMFKARKRIECRNGVSATPQIAEIVLHFLHKLLSSEV